MAARKRRLKLLDLFSGAGGAAVGYKWAGFSTIVGVDIEPQKNYPFKFVQADALEYLRAHGREFDFIHASPPCQGYSATARLHKDKDYPKLIEPTRELLIEIGKPYVIENVIGAPLIEPVLLCGRMFNLGVFRHRLFESNMFLMQMPHQTHQYKHGEKAGSHRGGVPKDTEIKSIYGHMFNMTDGSRAMGIDWMTSRDELAEAIPPAYTKFIGEQVICYLRSE